MSTPDSDGDHLAKRLGRKLREARLSANYRSKTPVVTVAIIYTLMGVAAVVGGAVSGNWWTLVIGALWLLIAAGWWWLVPFLHRRRERSAV
jgi:hypothetical protein